MRCGAARRAGTDPSRTGSVWYVACNPPVLDVARQAPEGAKTVTKRYWTRMPLLTLLVAIYLLLLHPGGVIHADELDAEAEETAESEGDEEQVKLGLRGDYQRVDGLVLGLEQDFRGRGESSARIHLAEAYALHRERWFYEAGFESPLLPQGFLVLGAEIYRQTHPFDGFDELIIGDRENALAALLVKEDYRDYYEEEGGKIFLRQPLGVGNSVQVGYVRSIHEVLENHTRASLIRWGESFRKNPAAEPGEFRAYRVGFERDTRDDTRSSGSTQWHRIEWERAGGGAGGDFEYSRLMADLRQYLKPSPGQTLAGRLLYGTNLSGRLPAQKEFALGGISTLRAHDFKEFVGDQALLANLEYRFDVTQDFLALVFVDVGAAARGEGRLSDQRFALDGGLGAGTLNGRATVTVGRDLHRSVAPFRVSFRLGSAF